jgi:hypothetical protein
MIWRTLTLALAATVLVVAACGGDDESSPAVKTNFEEGELRVQIEILDTGLLKGHAFVDAADEWIVTDLSVEAHDEEDVSWPVIEPERTGIDSANAQEFFEVAIQELPRGKQITVEAIATLQHSDGTSVERRVADNWPP